MLYLHFTKCLCTAEQQRTTFNFFVISPVRIVVYKLSLFTCTTVILFKKN